MSANDLPVIYIASDHAGLSLKNSLAIRLKAMGRQFEDFGTHNEASCDYPDFAVKVCRAVLENPGSFGILVCGTGIGMSMTANRIPGIRAALCTHEFHARATRAHNNANVLCLGERVTAPGLACELAEIFLSTPFEGGRHERRVEKIDASTSI